MDAMVLVTFHDQSVVVDRALAGKHMSADHLDQFSLRAVHESMTGEQKTFPRLLSKPMTATFRPNPRRVLRARVVEVAEGEASPFTGFSAWRAFCRAWS